MDPALQELLEGDPDEEIEAIVRLEPGEQPPAGMRIVARFDDVATCRVPRRDLRASWDDEAVISLKAPRVVGADVCRCEGTAQDSAELDEPVATVPDHRPAGLAPRGAGVVIGVVDWGCDFAHPDFRKGDGSTRLLALWDQRGRSPSSPQPYGYGRVHTKADIDRALRAPDPYVALGYHPGAGDPGGRGAHGTHVLSIAAGNGRGGGPVGLAPEADLVFVHLATGNPAPRGNLGDSVTILEAVHFVDRTAAARPCVINASVGRHGGPHDGSTLVERGLDNLVVSKPGRCMVHSCGNYYAKETHASGRLLPGRSRTLRWIVDAGDVTENELEVWYPTGDTFGVDVAAPGTSDWISVPLGGSARLTVGSREVGRGYHRRHDPNNRRHHINLFLDRAAPTGIWQVRLHGVDIVDGRFHAWVERDDSCRGCQSRFDRPDVDPRSSLGTVCTGMRTIAVGAFASPDPSRPVAPFSSAGPTLDGRQKPELVAPGVNVVAARSTPPGGTMPTSEYTQKSGTSMAAPYVTGLVACMYEAAARPLPVRTIRAALALTATATPSGTDPARVGAGYVNPLRSVAAVMPRAATTTTGRSAPTRAASEKEAAMDHVDDLDQGDVLAEIVEAREAAASVFESESGGAWEEWGEGDESCPAIELLDEAVASGDVLHSLDLVERALGSRPASVGRLFTEMVAGVVRPHDLLVAPGEVVPVLDTGDVVLRHSFEGDLAHAFVVMDDLLIRHDQVPAHARGDIGFGHYAQVVDPTGDRTLVSYRRVGDLDGRGPRDQVILRPGVVAPGHAIGEGATVGCLPGEGPPAAVPDPTGKGEHPLVSRGVGTARSRNPTVGYAQTLLNLYLADAAIDADVCGGGSAAVATYVARLRAELRANRQDPLVVDCRFGPNTERATKMFQACNELQPDGIIGPITWSHLKRYDESPPNPPDVGDDGTDDDIPPRATSRFGENVNELAEQVRVQSRLSLCQNHRIPAHTAFFREVADLCARQIGAIEEPGTRCRTPHPGPTTYTTGRDVIRAIAATKACTGQPIDLIYIFGHGTPNGLNGHDRGGPLGLFRTSNPRSRAYRNGERGVRDIPAGALARDVIVVITNCKTAREDPPGSSNFAKDLFNHIVRSSPGARVFGHFASGCVGRDTDWREYSAAHRNGLRHRTLPQFPGRFVAPQKCSR